MWLFLIFSKQNTVYEGDYHAKHQNIIFFWEAFENLTAEEKKKFFCMYSTTIVFSITHIITFSKWFNIISKWRTLLSPVFLTGCDRVPFQGMQSIRMTIAVLPNATERHLPESLTCHCLLLLPMYQRYPVDRTMQTRLRQAINHNRGFWKKHNTRCWSESSFLKRVSCFQLRFKAFFVLLPTAVLSK